MLTPESVQLAIQDLRAKSLDQIHYETAMVWLARAVAAHRLFIETRVARWLVDAEEYAHEALEHAALARDEMPKEKADLVCYVETMLLPLRRDMP